MALLARKVHALGERLCTARKAGLDDCQADPGFSTVCDPLVRRLKGVVRQTDAPLDAELGDIFFELP